MSSSALSNRNFVNYIVGATISLHGVWIYRVALGWFAWELTHSEFWVGVIAFTQFAPSFILAPIFGVFADRFDRRRSAILLNLLSFCNQLLLGVLAWQGLVDIYLLAALSLVQGMFDGAHAPVRMAIVPNLVDEDQLPNAIAFTSVAFNLSRFIGPALAGLVIATWDVGAGFAINGVSYLAYVVSLATIEIRPRRQGRVRKHPWHELLDGARYVLGHATIRALLVLSLVRCVLGRGSLEMLPAFADGVFEGGARALAIMTSAVGGGAIVAGLVLSRGTSWLTMKVIRIEIIAGGLFIALLGVVENFAMALPIVAILGTLLSLGGVGSQILIQTLVDDDVRGRVSSFWGAIVFGGTSLGALLIGAAAHAFGLQHAVLAAGLLTALIIVAATRSRG